MKVDKKWMRIVAVSIAAIMVITSFGYVFFM